MPGGSSAQGKRSSSRTRIFMRCHGEGLNLPVSAQPRRRSPAPAALLPAASPGSSDIPGVCVLLWAPPWRILWQLQRPERRRKISDPEKIIFSCVRCNVWLPHSKSASPERADYVGMSYVYRAGR